MSLDEVDDIAGSESVDLFWRKVLALLVGPSCDSFSLGGCESRADLTRIHAFNDWQPAAKDSVLVRFQWDAGTYERTRDLRLSRFVLGEEAVERLGRVPFRSWLSSNDACAADRLYFFSRRQLVLEAEPNELSLLFYELSAARRESLHAVEPFVAHSLNESGNWTATTLSVSHASKR